MIADYSSAIKKYDFPIHFRTPEWRMKIDRQIAAESRQKLRVLTV